MVDLSTLGSTSGGVWTREQARRLVPASTVRGLLADGSWQGLWPGVYADGGDVTPEQRCWAATLASGGTDAVACGRTAARLWGFPLVDDADPATQVHEHRIDEVITAPHRRTLRHAGRELRRHRFLLRPGDVVRTAGGPVTSALRTLVDCTRLLQPQAAVCVLDDALHRSLVRPDELAAAVASARRQPGSAALTSSAALADRRAESPFETLTRLVLLPVLPELEPQVELRDPRGWLVARFDLGDRRRRLAVESDGRAAHSGAQMVADARRRDQRTEELGWRTERVSWYDVRCRPERVRARVLRRAGPTGLPTGRGLELGGTARCRPDRPVGVRCFDTLAGRARDAQRAAGAEGRAPPGAGVRHKLAAGGPPVCSITDGTHLTVLTQMFCVESINS